MILDKIYFVYFRQNRNGEKMSSYSIEKDKPLTIIINNSYLALQVNLYAMCGGGEN